MKKAKSKKKTSTKAAKKKTAKKSVSKKEKPDITAMEEKIAWDILAQTDNEEPFTPEEPITGSIAQIQPKKKVKRQAKKSEPVKTAPEPAYIPPKTETKTEQKKQQTFKPYSILFLLLAISVLMNIYFFLDASDMKIKALSNADLAKKLVTENSTLKNELTNIKEKYSSLQMNMKEYATQMRDIASSNISNYQKLETDHTYQLGSLYAKAGMYDKAIQNFQKFLDLNGDDAGAFYNLALLYEQAKGNKREAVRYYKKYLEINPEANDLYEVTIRIDALEKNIKNPEVI